VAGERVIIEEAVLRIERDTVRCDLRRTFLLLIDRFFPFDDQLKILVQVWWIYDRQANIALCR
jgi:hypothetical protein